MLHLVLNVNIVLLVAVDSFALQYPHKWQGLADGESGTSTKIKFKKILAKRSALVFTKESTNKVKISDNKVVKRSLSYKNKLSQETNKLLSFEDKVSVHNIVRRSVNETNATSDEKCSLTCIIIIAACGAALLIFCLVVTIYYATCKYTEERVHDNWFGKKLAGKQPAPRNRTHSYIDERVKHFRKSDPDINFDWHSRPDAKYAIDNSTFYINDEDGASGVYPHFERGEATGDHFYQYQDVVPSYDFHLSKYKMPNNDSLPDYNEYLEQRFSQSHNIYNSYPRNHSYENRSMEIHDLPTSVAKEDLDAQGMGQFRDEEVAVPYKRKSVDLTGSELRNAHQKAIYGDNIKSDIKDSISHNRTKIYEEILFESKRNFKNMDVSSGNETDCSADVSNLESEADAEESFESSSSSGSNFKAKRKRKNFKEPYSVNNNSHTTTDSSVTVNDNSKKQCDTDDTCVSEISPEKLPVETRKEF